MKFEVENDGSTLLLRAETPTDLDYLESMRGVHQPGPWRDAQFVKTPVAELGFDPAGAGTSWVGRDGRISASLAAVRLRADWLLYKEPLAPELQLRAETASNLGHGVLNFFELLRSHP